MTLELPVDVAGVKDLLFALVLALPRVSGLIWVLPVISMNELPGLVRQVVAIALCLPLLPMTHHIATTVDLVPFVWMLTLFKELAIGAFIGFGLGVFVWVFAHLGELVDIQSGYSNLYMFNNILSTSTGPFATTSTQSGIALFIVLGGLRVALETLFGSYVVWPITDAVPHGRLLFEAFAITHAETLFSLTVKLAAPAMLILLLLDVALGLVGRFGRQLDLSSISYAIKALAGLVVIAMLLNFSVDIVGNVVQSSGALSRLLFGNAAAPGGTR